MTIFLLILVGVGAGFVQRVTGFGLGIFSMLFMPHFLPTHTMAASISNLFSCGTSTYNAIRFRKSIPFKTILPPLIAAMISVPIAVHFTAKISADLFNIILGIVLIGLSLYFLFLDHRIRIRPTVANGLLAGLLSGTLNGLFSTGGPPMVLYLTHATENKQTYFSGIQFYFCLTNIYAVLFRILAGTIDLRTLFYTVIGFAGCMMGNLLGGRVFNKLNDQRLKQIIYIAMIISGILMIL